MELSGCSGKKSAQDEVTDPAKKRITNKNVTKVLTEYGNQHPDSLVVISTPYGDIKARLYKDTPLHRANFVRLVKSNFFENADFYRIIKNFMIQGGYSDKTKMGLDRFLVPHEIDPRLFHKKGALAMAHHDEDQGSSPYDFYIVQGTVLTEDSVRAVGKALEMVIFPEQMQAYTTVGGSPHLDTHYTVFGEVVEGLALVDSIAAVPTDTTTEKPLTKIPIKVKVVSQ
jgi:peptidyl-prolyl cis-trans isomerase B (cyclophilin B)